MRRLNIIILLFIIFFQFACLKFYLRDDIDESEVLVLTHDDLECLRLPEGRNDSFRLVDLSSICRQFGRKELVYIKFKGVFTLHHDIKEIWCR